LKWCFILTFWIFSAQPLSILSLSSKTFAVNGRMLRIKGFV